MLRICYWLGGFFTDSSLLPIANVLLPTRWNAPNCFFNSGRGLFSVSQKRPPRRMTSKGQLCSKTGHSHAYYLTGAFETPLHILRAYEFRVYGQ
jgi:hypothetical protein